MSSGLDTDDLSTTFVPGASPSYFAPRAPSTGRFTRVLPGASGDGIVSSPDDGVGKTLSIDMKGMIGDAIGNLSISPSYRDVVLAARKGLFIIDLSAPDKLPRFLPQGGTWDVADVQWNPHPAREEYVVSTSSEKLLIWNLDLAGPTAIRHVLHAHYRSVTDINWHTVEPNIVVSTGIDSWLWAWDLRATQKPIMGLCAFNAGGTHVKWNRQNGHILASSHQDQVLIWDRRKGSIPVTKIYAHSAKIYGIDWAHNSSSTLITCSLDKTIKIWDTNEASDVPAPSRAHHPSEAPALAPRAVLHEPRNTIHTRYPVWRARDLPFGNGVLSLPQRGELALEMFHGANEEPVEVFDGHQDVVKEFVWRRGGRDWGDFQLITWSKDRTLKFQPVDAGTMARAGQPLDKLVPPRSQGYGTRSFHNPPTIQAPTPKTLLSAPAGRRGILDEVRAQPLLRPHDRTRHHHHRHAKHPVHAARYPSNQAHSHKTSSTSGTSQSYTSQSSALASTSGAESATPEATPTQTSAPMPISIAPPRMQATMTRGHAPGRSARPPGALEWLSSVRVVKEGTRADGGSSGTGSGTPSRMGSRSRPVSREGARRSSSRGGPRWDDDLPGSTPGTGVMSLQEELTSVLHKLAASKIKLEKHDLTRRRTCTLGLNGPWGASSSVFVRVSFAFPKDYPNSAPGSNPTVDLEPTPLIPLRARAHMLRRLRAMLETRRPVLEACLRFLLFGDDERPAAAYGEFDSSSDDESRGARVGGSRTRGRDAAVVMLHNNKNIAEPRTSQGVFGPDGRLIIFGRVPPRLIRNPLTELSVSPSVPTSSRGHGDSVPRFFKSPALISNAVHQLSVASLDRDASLASEDGSAHGGHGGGVGENIGDIMQSLMFAARGKARRPSAGASETNNAYALLQTRLSTVALQDLRDVVATGRDMAGKHVFQGPEALEKNEEIAKKFGRADHVQFFQTMRLLLQEGVQEHWGTSPLARTIVREVYAELAVEKDVQLLAIFAVLLLAMYHPAHPPRASTVRVLSPTSVGTTPGVRTPSGDYFTLRRRLSRATTASSSPAPSALPGSFGTASLNSASSRGSWSSLFNAGAGSMRQLLNTAENALGTTEDGVGREKDGSIPMPSGRSATIPNSPRKNAFGGGTGSYTSPRRAGLGAESPRPSSSPARGARGWGSPASSTGNRRLSVTFVPSRPTPAPTFSQVLAAKRGPSMRLAVVDLRDELRREEERELDVFPPAFVHQLLAHVAAYAEVLFRWEMPAKRIELLKAVDANLLALLDPPLDAGSSTLGVLSLCTHCGSETSVGQGVCKCGARVSKPLCSVCRLPIKGLSYACLGCQHVSHLSCWRASNIPACAAGCGCLCKGIGQGSGPPLSTSPLGLDLQPLPVI
ncbi:hypothetical protein PENSPDRAFT_760279 [Peniophora sp. CONT]|nr:hypothetical protein PENSPDRAFT_760279 [Peniophora sp. CONT]